MRQLHLAVLTTGRQDWGILRPLCEALRRDTAFQLSVLAGGMACSEVYGNTVDRIRAQGFLPAAEMDWQAGSRQPLDQASQALIMTGDALRRMAPDGLVVVGDRYETAAAGIAATILGVPIVHLYGGEETQGAIDNAFRHALTKLSHLHFVSHPIYAQRVVQMGEAPERVHVVGSLGVDNLFRQNHPTREEIEQFIGIGLGQPLGLVTVHPTTLPHAGQRNEVDAVIGAIKDFPATWVVTLPNADPGHEEIRAAFCALAKGSPNIAAVPALGEERYLGVMRRADFVLGNSSSGVIEAPSLRVPTINVGDRQKGRVRCPSIIDVACDENAIVDALKKAVSSDWKATISQQPLPFGDGTAAERIVGVLKSWSPPMPARKVFCDRQGKVDEA